MADKLTPETVTDEHARAMLAISLAFENPSARDRSVACCVYAISGTIDDLRHRCRIFIAEALNARRQFFPEDG